MNSKKLLVFILFLAVLILASGCTIKIGGGSASKGNNGGVWKSTDSGKNWAQTVAFATAAIKPVKIDKVNIRRMVFDPSDHNTIYLATEENGIIYTYDGGVSWRQFKALNKGKVRGVAVDSKAKCILYAIAENKLFKSNDCGRFWDNIYYHQNAAVALTDIVIDHFNTSNIYLANSAGEVLKSANGGQTWSTVERVDKAIFLDLVMDPKDSRVLYAASQKHGIYKTADAGKSWESLGEGLKSYVGSHDYQNLVIDNATPGSLILISKYGMLRTKGAGQTWEIVNLLPAPKSTTIYSVAVNPKDSQEIYYTTRTTLVKSIDGGQSWSSQKLPFSSSYLANRIIIDVEDPKIIYLGTFKASD